MTAQQHTKILPASRARPLRFNKARELIHTIDKVGWRLYTELRNAHKDAAYNPIFSVGIIAKTDSLDKGSRGSFFGHMVLKGREVYGNYL